MFLYGVFVKYLLLVGDGMADEPQQALGGKTPLEHAKTPNMDRIAAMGVAGLARTVPDSFAPGSDVANMSLLGYDPREYYTGRAPIEAAGLGIELDSRDTAFRCNLVITDGRIMRDYSAGHIESDDAYRLVDELRETLESGSVRLYRGVSYRHILVIRDFPVGSCHCTPPHDILDQETEPHLPAGAGADIVRSLMDKARKILGESPANQMRKSAGKPAVTDIWLWGQGRARRFPSLAERFSLRGSVITAVDLVRGLGALAGLNIPNVPGATGYLDTNYAGKVAAAKEGLENGDFVFVHIEAPDETSHEGSLEKKLRAIEDFDARVVGPLLEHVPSLHAWRVLVMPDHATLLATRTHDRRPVPYAMCGSNIEPDTINRYCESSGAQAGVVHTGVSLFQTFMTA